MLYALNTFSRDLCLKTQHFTRSLQVALICAFSPRNFAAFKSKYIDKHYKQRAKALEISVTFSEQGRRQIRQKVNNDVSIDPPITYIIYTGYSIFEKNG